MCIFLKSDLLPTPNERNYHSVAKKINHICDASVSQEFVIIWLAKLVVGGTTNDLCLDIGNGFLIEHLIKKTM